MRGAVLEWIDELSTDNHDYSGHRVGTIEDLRGVRSMIEGTQGARRPSTDS